MGLSDDLGDLADVPTQPEPTRRLDFDHAAGEGTLTTPPQPADDPVDFDAHLRALGYDPAAYRVDESGVRTSVWEAQTKTGIVTMRAIRARVVARHRAIGFDADRLIAEIRRHKRRTPPPTGDATLVVVLGDWQTGKPDGDGTAGTVARILVAIDAVVARAQALRRTGTAVDELLVLSVGDLLEGTDGFYANQAFTVELDRREQTRVTRRLLLKALTTWAPHFAAVTVAAVAGNHGEHRSGGGKGKFVTTVDDNDDLAVVEQVADVLAANPDAYGHVRFAVGGDPLTKTVETRGQILAITHGHIARASGGVEAKLRRWYEQQVTGARIPHADALVTGHYHHLRIADWGRTRWLQAPAMDGGSEWYAAVTGETSPPGLLTFVATESAAVNDIAIL